MNFTDIKNYIASISNKQKLNEFKESVNQLCDERTESFDIAESAYNISQRKFPELKETFENFAPYLFETKHGQAIIQNYIKLIKENKGLQGLHSLYENIRKADNNVDIETFISGIKENRLDEDNSLADVIQNLGDIIAKAYITITESHGKQTADTAAKITVNHELNQALKYIIENKQNKSNLADYSKAVNIIKNEIQSKTGQTSIFSNIDIDETLLSMTENFNRKYSGTSDNELSSMTAGKEKELFESAKSICLENIDTAIKDFESKSDNNSVKRLTTLKDQIGKKEYVWESFGTDYINFNKLNEILMQK